MQSAESSPLRETRNVRTSTAQASSAPPKAKRSAVSASLRLPSGTMGRSPGAKASTFTPRTPSTVVNSARSAPVSVASSSPAGGKAFADPERQFLLKELADVKKAMKKTELQSAQLQKKYVTLQAQLEGSTKAYADLKGKHQGLNQEFLRLQQSKRMLEKQVQRLSSPAASRGSPASSASRGTPTGRSPSKPASSPSSNTPTRVRSPAAASPSSSPSRSSPSSPSSDSSRRPRSPRRVALDAERERKYQETLTGLLEQIKNYKTVLETSKRDHASALKALKDEQSRSDAYRYRILDLENKIEFLNNELQCFKSPLASPRSTLASIMSPRTRALIAQSPRGVLLSPRGVQPSPRGVQPSPRGPQNSPRPRSSTGNSKGLTLSASDGPEKPQLTANGSSHSQELSAAIRDALSSGKPSF
eukprot:TRINITY_DN18967_c0_g2_i1.p1 TRINITY_DN18967_c0_g2~~TRINITY_DN18967_c0_g2_i1.p1  ORF type:complete len:417 (-),score=90.08 TRINITY_DN18967_c0_g2_i1:308-1558(-)